MKGALFRAGGAIRKALLPSSSATGSGGVSYKTEAFTCPGRWRGQSNCHLLPASFFSSSVASDELVGASDEAGSSNSGQEMNSELLYEGEAAAATLSPLASSESEAAEVAGTADASEYSVKEVVVAASVAEGEEITPSTVGVSAPVFDSGESPASASFSARPVTEVAPSSMHVPAPVSQSGQESVSLYSQVLSSYEFTKEPYSGTPAAGRAEHLWRLYFKDPTQWWDNRNRKRFSAEPDFQKKGTKEPLWLDRNTPSWVEGGLAALAQRREQLRRPGFASYAAKLPEAAGQVTSEQKHVFGVQDTVKQTDPSISTSSAQLDRGSNSNGLAAPPMPSYGGGILDLPVDSLESKKPAKPETSPEAIKRVNKALDDIMLRIKEKEKRAAEQESTKAPEAADGTTADGTVAPERKPSSLIRRYPRHNRRVLEQEGEEGRLESTAEYHSEKLAIAYGLLKTPPGTTIRIFKNLRVCVDCHEFTKAVTRVTGREIIARDANRFHHFKDGQCSCNDYW